MLNSAFSNLTQYSKRGMKDQGTMPSALRYLRHCPNGNCSFMTRCFVMGGIANSPINQPIAQQRGDRLGSFHGRQVPAILDDAQVDIKALKGGLEKVIGRQETGSELCKARKSAGIMQFAKARVWHRYRLRYLMPGNQGTPGPMDHHPLSVRRGSC